MVRPLSRGGVPVLKRAHVETQPIERLADAGVGGSPAAARELALADVQEALAGKCRREHHGPGAIDGVAAARGRRRSAAHAVGSFDQQVFDRFLPQRKVGLNLDDPLDLLLVGPLVGLGARTVHGRALAAVEHAELDAGRVDGPAHGAAQGVDLADDLPLGHAADGRVAAHLGDRVEVDRQQGGVRAHPRGGQRGLDAGVAGADHDHVEIETVGGDHTFHHTSARRTSTSAAWIAIGRPLATNGRRLTDMI